MLQSMGFSPHRAPFEERLAKWEQQLRLVRPGRGLGPVSGVVGVTAGRGVVCWRRLVASGTTYMCTCAPWTPRPQVSDVLEQWVALQRAWMYLEPVFASKDIQQQLPAEAKRFAAVDRGWRRAMDAAKRAPGVIKVEGGGHWATGQVPLGLVN